MGAVTDTLCDNPHPFLLRRLPGLQDYGDTLEAMRRFTDSRAPDTLDEIWLLEHPPVFTLGQAGRREHLLDPGDIPVIQVDRGGQVTYHGPGQLVAYMLLDLRRIGFGVKRFVNMLEQSVIELLDSYGIDAARRQDAPGVYVADAKIASLGLRIRNGCSYHGLSLNVSMDLEPFRRINPCGYAGLAMTQISDLVSGVSVADAGNALIATLGKVFDLRMLGQVRPK
ncbi:lipoyl(octanoyl) transferase LipB [Imhoffiella purpurea]|uniref:Octanoyltransferase n=1 Tax=Imhoffiella purpurea TaxID=1249627 RepID=W9VCP4_9GAMM|nr:lipoyl(octanoyl) transferase LipB [Imhoffiella purpurea]EXJ17229.1 Octanoate-[acyl-carrier-protein]-protein-N-octanoyltransferase [Imhoffiella purpurea]